MAEARSPLRRKALPAAGEGLANEKNEIRINRRLARVLPFIVAVLAIFAWADLAYPPQRLTLLMRAVIYTVFTVIFATLVLRKDRFWVQREQAVNLGLEGERVVGEAFDALRPLGYVVFHNVLAEKENIDHVLVGPGGVFAIETKTRSKRHKDSRLVRNGEELFFDGSRDSDAIPQARRNARWLADYLERTSSHAFRVQPVVVAPGWYIDGGGSRGEIWLLTDKGLVTTLRRWPGPNMTAERIGLANEAIQVRQRAQREQES